MCAEGVRNREIPSVVALEVGGVEYFRRDLEVACSPHGARFRATGEQQHELDGDASLGGGPCDVRERRAFPTRGNR